MVAINGERSHPNGATSSRKADHLRINLEEDVAAKGVSTGFDAYRFMHCALPDIDLDEVSTATEVLGWQLASPLFISCMTGGTEQAARINMVLAETAAELGIALGLGSARVLLERPEALPSFAVREIAPTVPLLANLGAVQLNLGVSSGDCARLVDMLGADALVLHLNALQEALQPEGDTCFAGLLGRIETVAASLAVPVIVKEVGWGISADLVTGLLDAGVAAVDVAGAGGTSWSEVERHRLGGPAAGTAAAFAGWGIPTAVALTQARTAAPDGVIFASGGVRSGLDVAVASALGADLVGVAGPFLRAAAFGTQACVNLGREWFDVLRIAMFCTGSRDLPSLRSSARLVREDGGPVPGADGVTLVASLIETISDLRGTQVTRTAARG
ncbi:MAG: type 2 isopentenyl-diphosphate Delta-isomerase [Candidatus Aeolococcus gillhamiae]|uniref:Isopentenyl-diphosphate delta-isomerase n=1 Tax=Candidatus Aeolococcus gillhamiae TaxID=3127015 RepID=A0A2W5ZIE0_9BACT|nr:MAG: type 2 isopentenyl-diphosphate Delta-isomerase [Candidatus Dormibacter sp. RRmetagenome_bin12]